MKGDQGRDRQDTVLILKVTHEERKGRRENNITG